MSQTEYRYIQSNIYPYHHYFFFQVTVHYGGFLMDGTKFDSSFDRRKPFTFELGVGQVIPGWDQGLIGVCKGEERHLVVPSELAYGERGAGEVIPAGATLLFDVVVVDVEKVPHKQHQCCRNHFKSKSHILADSCYGQTVNMPKNRWALVQTFSISFK